jgi:hypothetical protein
VTTLSSAQTKTNDNVTKLQGELTDLTDRVDQVETALEEQSAGGP